MKPDIEIIDNIIKLALQEDVGQGDITSLLTIPEQSHCSFSLIAREDMIVAGVDIAARVFNLSASDVNIDIVVNDGTSVSAGDVLLSGEGNARNILTLERTALNLLQHLSGVATLTRKYVDAVDDTKARVLDTRKTTPGLRILEKYAVKMGGGYNHRMRLDDGVLIKDNHIAINKGIKNSVRTVRDNLPSLTRIEIECDTLDQVKEALETEVDVIMLDNMDIAQIKQAVDLVGRRKLLEASGNVNLDTISGIAKTGVDYISVGRITHSAPSMDIGLDINIIEK
jgi:nicotinate-nucleotide pyrophosphorylase (carboxylating)